MAAPLIMRVVDPNTLLPIFDCQSFESGFANPGGVTTWVSDDDGLSLGDLTPVSSLFSPPARPEGALRTFTRQDAVAKSWTQHIKATSFENLRAGLAVLENAIAYGRSIEFQQAGQVVTGYIDIIDGTIPSLLRGQSSAGLESFGLLELDIPISIKATPTIRGVKLDATLNKLKNPCMLWDADANGRPDLWVWSAAGTPTAESIIAADAAYGFRLSVAAVRDLQQTTLAASAAPGDVWTFHFQCRYQAATPNKVGRVSAKIEYLDNTGTLIGGGSSPGTTTSTLAAVVDAAMLTDPRCIVSVTTPAAPALTDRIRVSLEFNDSAASNCDMEVGYAQLIKAASAQPFRVQNEGMTNDPAATTTYGRSFLVYNPGSAPAPCELTLSSADAAAALADILIAARSDESVSGNRAITDLMGYTAWAQCDASANGWTRTLGTDTANNVDATASGGNAARVSHATTPTVAQKRITLTRTTRLDSLRGDHDVYIRVKAAAASIYWLQLRYGPNATSPAAYTLPEVFHDTSSATTFDWCMVKLGRIRLPRETTVTLGTLGLEVWSRMGVGKAAANLDLDYCELVPAENQGRITVPGGSASTINGNLLTTPPFKITADPVWVAGDVASGFPNSLRLNAVNEGGGWGTNAGDIVGVGRHVATFSITVSGNPSGTGTTAKVRVVNVTDNAEIANVAISQIPGQYTYVIAWDGVAAKRYQPEGVITVYSTGSYFINSITYQLLPYVAQNERIRTDPGSVPSRYAVEKLDSAGSLVSNLSAATIPVWLPPGLSLLMIDPLDVKVAGYNESKSVLARTLTLTPNVYPRWWS